MPFMQTKWRPYDLRVKVTWMLGCPPKCPFPWGDRALTSPHPKRHLDWFSRFCKVRDRETNTATDHADPSAALARIYVTTA